MESSRMSPFHCDSGQKERNTTERTSGLLNATAILLYANQINAATAFRPAPLMTITRGNDRWASNRRLHVKVETHDS
jgi:hypothetical protein